MTDEVLLHITIDHQVVFAWAQRRGARPSIIEGDERPWPLFFNFNIADGELKEISWDRFFEEFERAGLAFVYRDATPMANWMTGTSSSNELPCRS
jgi:hypothetical protein